jgi:putative cardiolipin synthase
VPRTPSAAITASADTELGRIALASAKDPALSGFRLMSWSEQSFATRLALAARAERSLDVQYYVFDDDGTGRVLMRALRDAAARGVRVRLLLDDLYTGGNDPLLLGLARIRTSRSACSTRSRSASRASAPGSRRRCSTSAG